MTPLIAELQAVDEGTIDWGYLQHAVAVLLECRRVLGNAYIFSYFMFNRAAFSQVRRTRCCLPLVPSCFQKHVWWRHAGEDGTYTLSWCRDTSCSWAQQRTAPRAAGHAHFPGGHAASFVQHTSAAGERCRT